MLFETTKVPVRKCSCGLEQRVAVLLSYAIFWAGGFVFFFMEKKNKFVRFSAMQSIIVGTAWFAAWLSLMLLGGLLGMFADPLKTLFFALNVLVGAAAAGVIAILAIQGWKGNKVALPIAGALAESWSKTIEA